MNKKLEFVGMGPNAHVTVNMGRVPCGCEGTLFFRGGTEHPKDEHTLVDLRQFRLGDTVDPGDLSDDSERSRILNNLIDRKVCRFVMTKKKREESHHADR